MIPSFYPVREHVEAVARERRARGVGLPHHALLDGRKDDRVDPNTGLKIKSIDELLSTASKVRYADTPFLDYAGLVAREFAMPEATPVTIDGEPLFGKSVPQRPRIAVIGGGMSGLLCAWQLAKLGAQVDIHEAAAQPNGDASAPQGAGRIRPVNVIPDDPATRAELGAMRFPDTAYLFWHYVALSLDDAWEQRFVEFPNPGKVPSLLSGEKLLSGVWRTAGREITSLDDDGHDLRSIAKRHVDAFLMIEAGGYTVLDVSAHMVDGSAAAAPWIQAGIDRFWKTLSARYYRTSYRDFLEQSGLFTPDEVRIIGYLGLGTGGFSPLFDTCVLDILRLFLWDFSAEYAVPDLYKVPLGLLNAFKRAAQPQGGSYFERSAVDYIVYSRQTLQYTLVRANLPTGAAYDYVVAATSHAALRELVDAAPAELPAAVVAQATDPVCPFSTRLSPTSAYFSDVRSQQGISSIKIFQSMAGPETDVSPGAPMPYPTVDPEKPIEPWVRYQNLVRVAFGNGATDAPLGVTYVLPWIGNDFPSSLLVNGLHYSWGKDSDTLRTLIASWSETVINGLDATGVFIARDAQNSTVQATELKLGASARLYEASISGRALMRTSASLTLLMEAACVARQDGREQVAGTENSANFPVRFNAFVGGPEPLPGQGFLAVVDWDRVPYVRLGFKLDAPGRGYPSIYRFRTQQVSSPNILESLNRWETPDGKTCDSSVSKFYFCGDSFSHFGGWVEGAFQSALNVVAAIACREGRQFVDMPWRRLVDLAPEPFPSHLYPNGPTDA